MFPNRITPKIAETIKSYGKEALGWKISGAGGGGYLVLVSEKRVERAMQVSGIGARGAGDQNAKRPTVRGSI